MDQYEFIRKRVIRDGVSRRKLSRQTGFSRTTIEKALRYSSPPGYQQKQDRRKPVIDKYREIIEEWIDQDKMAPRKQRHTAQRMYERLCEEHGYTGSAVTVRRYVRDVKDRSHEAYFPLSFGPGEEGQVDWTEGWVMINEVMTKVSFFCLSLNYSTGSYVRAYQRQNQESFEDGHVRAFEFFGGVPRSLAYDNLKTAVIKVYPNRKRDVNEHFKGLRSHYLFETRFCNVRRGNEKGGVENRAKWVNKSLLTPIPHVSSYEDLNKELERRCRLHSTRKGSKEGINYAERYRVEQSALMPLPRQRYEACIKVSSMPTKQALMRYDGNDYSVPVKWVCQPCVLKAYATRIKIYAKGEEISNHKRSYEKSQQILEPLHYIPLLKSKPGGVHHAKAFQNKPWGDEFETMKRELIYRNPDTGSRQFVNILLLFQKFPQQDVTSAVKSAVKSCLWSDDAVIHILEQQDPPPVTQLDTSSRDELNNVSSGIRDAAEYEQLMESSQTLQEEVA